MVTSKDIARELNLSQSTVSRILSGEEGYRAAEATRQRVWETARRLQYQPNAVARSLRRGRTHTIGIYTSQNYDVRNEFLGTIVGALQRACVDLHLDLLLHSGGDAASAETMFGKLRDGRVDGLILRSNSDEPLVRLLGQSSLPVVAVADSLAGLPSVTCDDESGVQQLLELLWTRQHRRFVFLAPKITLPSVEKRVAAFERELQVRGVAPEFRRVQRIDFEQVKPLLEELCAQAPLTVCCWNDRTAYNLLEVALEAGVQVPKELSITGFDGLRETQLLARQLTTVRCPWEDVAVRALDMLVAIIKDRSADSEEGEVVSPQNVVSLRPWILPGNTS